MKRGPQSFSNQSELGHLAFLKLCVDPLKPKDRNQKRQFQSDFIRMPVKEFNTIIERFADLFTNHFNRNPIWEKVEAIWLYMGLSLFMKHHQASPLMKDRNAKLQLLEDADKKIGPIIGETIAEINNHISNGSFAARHMDFHQKILHIHWTLLRFYKSIRNISLEELIKMPFAIAEDKLKIAQAIAKTEREKLEQNKPKQYGDAYNPEAEVNAEVSKYFQAGTVMMTLKDPGQVKYIDERTGVELDLALSYRLSIETDGPEHVAHDVHTVIHTLKALALRESGVQRIPLDVNKVIVESQMHIKIAKGYGEIFNNQAMVEYLELTDRLDILRNRVRTAIEEMQRMYAFPNSQAERHLIRKHFQSMMIIDSKLRDFANIKRLEKLFLNIQNTILGYSHSPESQGYLNLVNFVSQSEERLMQTRTELQATMHARTINEEKIPVLLLDLEKAHADLSAQQQMLKEQIDKKERNQAKFDELRSHDKEKHAVSHNAFIRKIDSHIAHLQVGLTICKEQYDKLEKEIEMAETAIVTSIESEEKIKASELQIENQIATLEQQKQQFLMQQLESNALRSLLDEESSRLQNEAAQFNASFSAIQARATAESDILSSLQQAFVPGFVASKDKRIVMIEGKRESRSEGKRDAKVGRTDEYDYARAQVSPMV